MPYPDSDEARANRHAPSHHAHPTGRLGRLLCFVGLHRWEFKMQMTDVTIRDYARCRRSCQTYDRWMCVNEEPRRLPFHPAAPTTDVMTEEVNYEHRPS
jgi:hypothetical protein